MRTSIESYGSTFEKKENKLPKGIALHFYTHIYKCRYKFFI